MNGERQDLSKSGFAVCLGVILAAALLLGLRWQDHLLMWDEAMNLLSARAFAAGGSDHYSPWFWRYPPMLQMLLQAIAPLAEGFPERAERLMLVLHVVLVGVLGLTVAATSTRRAGAIAAAAFAAMPATVFYSLWIKQDGLAILFGLVAILLFARGRVFASGLVLGLSLLSKEFGAFFGLAIGSLWLARPSAERRFSDLLRLGVPAVVLSAWWYLLLSASVRQYAAYAAGAGTFTGAGWDFPWWLYFDQLLLGAGPLALAAAALGAALLLAGARRAAPAALWPVALLVPTLVVITIVKGKMPWYMLTLLPAIAALAGIAVDRLGAAIAARTTAAGGTAATLLLGLVLAGVTAYPVFGRSYAEQMRVIDRNMEWTSTASRTAAVTLNDLAEPGERALITPMHYYGKNVPFPCPIFVVYLGEREAFVAENTISVDAFRDAVREHRIDVAMVSPPPPEADALLVPLIRDDKLPYRNLPGAVVFRTSSLYR